MTKPTGKPKKTSWFQNKFKNKDTPKKAKEPQVPTPMKPPAAIELLAKAGASHSLPPEYLPAIARQESDFDPKAQVNTGADGSRGGAYGLTQMTLKTAQGLGYKGAPEGLLDPKVNAEFAALHALDCARRYGLQLDDIFSLACCHNAGRPLGRITNPAVHAAVQSYANSVQMYAAALRDECEKYAPPGV